MLAIPFLCAGSMHFQMTVFIFFKTLVSTGVIAVTGKEQKYNRIFSPPVHALPKNAFIGIPKFQP